jgi:hypothetical protein
MKLVVIILQKEGDNNENKYNNGRSKYLNK